MKKLLNKISLTGKLSILYFIGFVGVLAVGYIAFSSMNKIKTNLDRIYFGGIVHLNELKTIADLYTLDMVETIEKTKKDMISLPEGKKKIKEAFDSIHKNWEEYATAYHNKDDAKLVRNTNAKLLIANKFFETILRYYETGNMDAIKAVPLKDLFDTVDSLRGDLNKLMDVQAAFAKREKNKANENFIDAIQELVVSVLLVAVIVLFLTTPIMNNIRLHQKKLESTSVNLKELNERLEKERDQLTRLTGFLSSLNSVNVSAIAYAALKEIMDATGSQMGLFYRYVNGRLKLLSSDTVDEKALKSARLSFSGEGMPLKALQENRWLSIDDIESGSALPLIDTGLFKAPLKSVTAIPIVFQDRKLGAIVLASITAKSQESAFLTGYVTTLAHALNNAVSYVTVQKQSNRLAQANRELESANRLKSEFLANVSHELRTPLNSVIGFSSLLMKNKQGRFEEKDLSFLEKINRNGIHLLKIINDILDLSKIEAGRMEVQWNRISLIPALRSTLEMFRHQASENKISLELRGNLDQEIEIMSDEQKIRQILINLVGNALKFVEPVSGKVEVLAKTGDKEVLLSIKDNGIGIAPEKQATIFEAFRQADGSRSKEYGGTGLGLSISKNLTERLGGTLTLQSHPGQGSVFTVALPRHPLEKDRANNEEMEDDQHHPPGDDTLTMLHIDDDEDSRCILMEYAIEAGVRVVSAKNGNEGLQKAASHHPDLIVLDILLPDMSGWEVLKALKGAQETAEIPVVVISIVTDEKIAYTLGADAALAKPLTTEDISRAVSPVMQRRRQKT